MEHHGSPEVQPTARSCHHLARACAELVGEQRVDVLGANTAGRELVAIANLGQERLASQTFGGVFDRVFEGLIFEGVQRVVMHEDADRALSRQEVREIIDHPAQRMIGNAVVVGHRRGDRSAVSGWGADMSVGR